MNSFCRLLIFFFGTLACYAGEYNLFDSDDIELELLYESGGYLELQLKASRPTTIYSPFSGEIIAAHPSRLSQWGTASYLLKSANGFLLRITNIESAYVLGDEVEGGAALGSSLGLVTITVYDSLQSQWLDPRLYAGEYYLAPTFKLDEVYFQSQVSSPYAEFNAYIPNDIVSLRFELDLEHSAASWGSITAEYIDSAVLRFMRGKEEVFKQSIHANDGLILCYQDISRCIVEFKDLYLNNGYYVAQLVVFSSPVHQNKFRIGMTSSQFVE